MIQNPGGSLKCIHKYKVSKNNSFIGEKCLRTDRHTAGRKARETNGHADRQTDRRRMKD